MQDIDHMFAQYWDDLLLMPDVRVCSVNHAIVSPFSQALWARQTLT